MSKNSIQSTALEPGPDHYQGSGIRYVLHKLIRGIPVYGLVIACLGLILFFSILLPESFPTPLNLRLLINNNAIVAILALTAMTPMVTGKIDLSVGYGVVLWEILMIGLTSQQGIPWPLTVIIILALGTLYGVFNALLVEIAQIDAFIATLGTGSVLYAIALWYSDGKQIVGQLPDMFYLLESQAVFGVPIMAIYVLGIAVLLWLVLTFTPLGRYLYAVGANAEASRLNGIRTQRCIVADGVAEAAKVIGWKYRVLNGRGSVSGRAGALSQAIALKPDAIILGGFNAQEDASDVTDAVKRGIKIVGWHAASDPGPIKDPKVFTNITTPAKQTGVAAAYLAIAKSDGKANAIIFGDTAYDIAWTKAKIMAETLKKCEGCKVLKLRDASLASATSDMPQVASSYLQKYGSKWTYTLGINDLYFDGMASTLSAAGIPPQGPPYNISAGDGSQSAFQRIRSNRYQYATIPEPLYEQAWQAVDELNRAFAGKPPSDFVAPIHIVTPKNVSYIKGSNGIYDPDNQYRKHYREIWGKQK